MRFAREFRIGSLVLICLIYFFVYTAARQSLLQASLVVPSAPATIMIDPGHGGEDSGATSVSGIAESGINLSISQKLEHLLAFCGINTIMIRTEDVSVHTEGNTVRERKVSDLKHRVEMINEVNNAVLVSIHQNHFPESKYSGAQVFYADTEDSKKLAATMQQMLRQALNPANTREIKKAASVYLMEKIQCTGILVECGFLSNPQEDIMLQDEDYQRKLVCAIGAALAQHLEKGNTEIEI